MSAAELLEILHHAQAVLSLEGGRLKVKMPESVLTPELRAALAIHREELKRRVFLEAGQCSVHGRWLCFHEQQAGACFWCIPEAWSKAEGCRCWYCNRQRAGAGLRREEIA